MKRTFVGVMAVGFLVAGCGSDAASSPSTPTAPPNPLDTPKTATCQDWINATSAQRDEASLRFVKLLHAADPSAAFAHSFAGNILTECEAGPTLKLPEVVGALATLDTADFPR